VAQLSAAEVAGAAPTAGPPADPGFAANTMRVNAGIVTGNYATTATSSSGGAQNLVRFMEDWTGTNVNFKGSEGRLFTSTQYTGMFKNTNGVVYKQPTRSFDFDSNIPVHPPPGNPTTTAFGRGDFFTW
jgi:hypothetical protein